MQQRGLPFWAKRSFDVAVATSMLIVSAPALLGAAAAIAMTMGRPILFRQRRPGRDGVPFEILKLRTMMVEPGAGPESDARRLTALGRLLRASSIDELPQLWNVLRGEMSLVGPRPLLLEYLPLYSAEQARRHAVLPGITGWAQVNGRNALSHEQRFELDVWSVDHWSLALDLKILWLTIARTLARSGVSASGHVTMPPFRGLQSEQRAA